MGIALRELQHCNTATVLSARPLSLAEELIQERERYRRKKKKILVKYS